jgi:hypothetical protein
MGLSPDERDRASELVQHLMNYNNGLTGPGHCPDEPPTPTVLSSRTPTATKTLVFGSNHVSLASLTPLPPDGGGGGSAFQPTAPTGTATPGTPEPSAPVNTVAVSPEPSPPAETQPSPTQPVPWLTPSPPVDTPSPPPPTLTLPPLATPTPEATDTLPPPPPPPTDTPPPGDGCANAYPDFCIPPPPPDLDCGDIDQKNFTVLPPDPHGFDGDNDGIGCES